MKTTCLSDHGGGGYTNFTGAKNCPYKGKEPNTLIASSAAKAMKLTKKHKAKSKEASKSDEEADHLNF